MSARLPSRSASRRLIGIVVTVSLVLMTPAGAQTDPAADPTISVSDTLEPEGRITSAKAPSSALAQTDPALLERSDAEPIQVAIKLDYDAVAVYTGGIPGLEPTSPSVTGVPLSERPAAAVEYEDHVAAREQAFVDALTDVVPSAEVGTSLRTVYGGISAIIPANEVENVLAIPGAVAVQLNDLRQPLTDSSPEFVNATALYAALGTTANAGDSADAAMLAKLGLKAMEAEEPMRAMEAAE